jgi:hypothetical protein
LIATSALLPVAERAQNDMKSPSEAAIAATWASVWVRAFLAYGISRSIDHRSTLSAGHGL